MLKSWKSLEIFGLIFNIICLILYSINYFYIDLDDIKSHLAYFFRYCYVTFCTVYHLFYFFDVIFDLAETNGYISGIYKPHPREVGGFCCLLIFGIIILVFSYLRTDFICCLMGMLFSIGTMVISAKDKKRKKGGNRIDGNLGVSIFMFIVLLINSIVLIVRFKDKY